MRMTDAMCDLRGTRVGVLFLLVVVAILSATVSKTNASRYNEKNAVYAGSNRGAFDSAKRSKKSLHMENSSDEERDETLSAAVGREGGGNSPALNEFLENVLKARNELKWIDQAVRRVHLKESRGESGYGTSGSSRYARPYFENAAFGDREKVRRKRGSEGKKENFERKQMPEKKRVEEEKREFSGSPRRVYLDDEMKVKRHVDLEEIANSVRSARGSDGGVGVSMFTGVEADESRPNKWAKSDKKLGGPRDSDMDRWSGDSRAIGRNGEYSEHWVVNAGDDGNSRNLRHLDSPLRLSPRTKSATSADNPRSSTKAEDVPTLESLKKTVLDLSRSLTENDKKIDKSDEGKISEAKNWERHVEETAGRKEGPSKGEHERDASSLQGVREESSNSEKIADSPVERNIVGRKGVNWWDDSRSASEIFDFKRREDDLEDEEDHEEDHEEDPEDGSSELDYVMNRVKRARDEGVDDKDAKLFYRAGFGESYLDARDPKEAHERRRRSGKLFHADEERNSDENSNSRGFQGVEGRMGEAKPEVNGNGLFSTDSSSTSKDAATSKSDSVKLHDDGISSKYAKDIDKISKEDSTKSNLEKVDRRGEEETNRSVESLEKEVSMTKMKDEEDKGIKTARELRLDETVSPRLNSDETLKNTPVDPLIELTMHSNNEKIKNEVRVKESEDGVTKKAMNWNKDLEEPKTTNDKVAQISEKVEKEKKVESIDENQKKYLKDAEEKKNTLQASSNDVWPEPKNGEKVSDSPLTHDERREKVLTTDMKDRLVSREEKPFEEARPPTENKLTAAEKGSDENVPSKLISTSFDAEEEGKQESPTRILEETRKMEDFSEEDKLKVPNFRDRGKDDKSTVDGEHDDASSHLEVYEKDTDSINHEDREKSNERITNSSHEDTTKLRKTSTDDKDSVVSLYEVKIPSSFGDEPKHADKDDKESSKSQQRYIDLKKSLEERHDDPVSYKDTFRDQGDKDSQEERHEENTDSREVEQNRSEGIRENPRGEDTKRKLLWASRVSSSSADDPEFRDNSEELLDEYQMAAERLRKRSIDSKIADEAYEDKIRDEEVPEYDGEKEGTAIDELGKRSGSKHTNPDKDEDDYDNLDQGAEAFLNYEEGKEEEDDDQDDNENPESEERLSVVKSKDADLLKAKANVLIKEKLSKRDKEENPPIRKKRYPSVAVEYYDYDSEAEDQDAADTNSAENDDQPGKEQGDSSKNIESDKCTATHCKPISEIAGAIETIPVKKDENAEEEARQERERAKLKNKHPKQEFIGDIDMGRSRNKTTSTATTAPTSTTTSTMVTSSSGGTSTTGKLVRLVEDVKDEKKSDVESNRIRQGEMGSHFGDSVSDSRWFSDTASKDGDRNPQRNSGKDRTAVWLESVEHRVESRGRTKPETIGYLLGESLPDNRRLFDRNRQKEEPENRCEDRRYPEVFLSSALDEEVDEIQKNIDTGPTYEELEKMNEWKDDETKERPRPRGDQRMYQESETDEERSRDPARFGAISRIIDEDDVHGNRISKGRRFLKEASERESNDEGEERPFELPVADSLSTVLDRSGSVEPAAGERTYLVISPGQSPELSDPSSKNSSSPGSSYRALKVTDDLFKGGVEQSNPAEEKMREVAHSDRPTTERKVIETVNRNEDSLLKNIAKYQSDAELRTDENRDNFDARLSTGVKKDSKSGLSSRDLMHESFVEPLERNGDWDDDMSVRLGRGLKSMSGPLKETGQNDLQSSSHPVAPFGKSRVKRYTDWKESPVEKYLENAQNDFLDESGNKVRMKRNFVGNQEDLKRNRVKRNEDKEEKSELKLEKNLEPKDISKLDFMNIDEVSEFEKRKNGGSTDVEEWERNSPIVRRQQLAAADEIGKANVESEFEEPKDDFFRAKRDAQNHRTNYEVRYGQRDPRERTDIADGETNDKGSSENLENPNYKFYPNLYEESNDHDYRDSFAPGWAHNFDTNDPYDDISRNFKTHHAPEYYKRIARTSESREGPRGSKTKKRRRSPKRDIRAGFYVLRPSDANASRKRRHHKRRLAHSTAGFNNASLTSSGNQNTGDMASVFFDDNKRSSMHDRRNEDDAIDFDLAMIDGGKKVLHEYREDQTTVKPEDESQKKKFTILLAADNMEDESQMDLALHGELAGKIVERIFEQVQSDPTLKTALGPGLYRRHRPEDSVTSDKEYRQDLDKDEVKHTEMMMKRVMELLGRLVLDEVQRKTCAFLPPDMREFLHWILGVEQEEALSDQQPPLPLVHNQDVTKGQDKFLFDDSNRSYLNVKVEELYKKVRLLEGLINEYNALTEREKTRVQSVHDYLVRQLKLLLGYIEAREAAEAKQKDARGPSSGSILQYQNAVPNANESNALRYPTLSPLMVNPSNILKWSNETLGGKMNCPSGVEIGRVKRRRTRSSVRSLNRDRRRYGKKRRKKKRKRKRKHRKHKKEERQISRYDKLDHRIALSRRKRADVFENKWDSFDSGYEKPVIYSPTGQLIRMDDKYGSDSNEPNVWTDSLNGGLENDNLENEVSESRNRKRRRTEDENEGKRKSRGNHVTKRRRIHLSGDDRLRGGTAGDNEAPNDFETGALGGLEGGDYRGMRESKQRKRDVLSASVDLQPWLNPEKDDELSSKFIKNLSNQLVRVPSVTSSGDENVDREDEKRNSLKDNPEILRIRATLNDNEEEIKKSLSLPVKGKNLAEDEALLLNKREAWKNENERQLEEVAFGKDIRGKDQEKELYEKLTEMDRRKAGEDTKARRKREDGKKSVDESNEKSTNGLSSANSTEGIGNATNSMITSTNVKISSINDSTKSLEKLKTIKSNSTATEAEMYEVSPLNYTGRDDKIENIDNPRGSEDYLKNLEERINVHAVISDSSTRDPLVRSLKELKKTKETRKAEDKSCKTNMETSESKKSDKRHGRSLQEDVKKEKRNVDEKHRQDTEEKVRGATGDNLELRYAGNRKHEDSMGEGVENETARRAEERGSYQSTALSKNNKELLRSTKSEENETGRGRNARGEKRQVYLAAESNYGQRESTGDQLSRPAPNLSAVSRDNDKNTRPDGIDVDSDEDNKNSLNKFEARRARKSARGSEGKKLNDPGLSTRPTFRDIRESFVETRRRRNDR